MGLGADLSTASKNNLAVYPIVEAITILWILLDSALSKTHFITSAVFSFPVLSNTLFCTLYNQFIPTNHPSKANKYLGKKKAPQRDAEGLEIGKFPLLESFRTSKGKFA